MVPTREDARHLLQEWTPGQNLRRHGLAVVAWYGEHRYGQRGSDLQTWRIAGLLHDFDDERYPDTHPLRGAEELRRLGYPELVVEAVLGHGDHMGMPRRADLARTDYACDEMSRSIVAVALVPPNRSLDEVDVRSVTRKMKDKGFARQVPREQLVKGAEEIGVPLEEHIMNVVRGLAGARGVLGL